MKLYRVIAMIGTEKSTVKVKDMEVEEKPNSYTAKGFRLMKSQLMEPFAGAMSNIAPPFFINVYCLEMDLEMAKKLAEDAVINAFMHQFIKFQRAISKSTRLQSFNL